MDLSARRRSEGRMPADANQLCQLLQYQILRLSTEKAHSAEVPLTPLAIFLHVGARGGRSASDVMLNAKPGGGPWKPSWCDSRSFQSFTVLATP